MPKNNCLHNRILERLPAPDYQRLVSLIELVTLPVGKVVVHPGDVPRCVHFPISAVLSSMVVLEDGSTIEGSTIGNEGMDGLYLLAEPLPNPCEISVQIEGLIVRIAATAFKKFLKESDAMSQLLVRYAMFLIQRGEQNGACIQHHTIEQRMCRWLLENSRRIGKDSFHMTQEFLSDMLGIRRQSVNFVAGMLQQAKLIRYHRGEMTIIDRCGLEEVSCECFRLINETYE